MCDMLTGERGQDRDGEVQGDHWAAQRPLEVMGTALHGDPSMGLRLPPGVAQEEQAELGLTPGGFEK